MRTKGIENLHELSLESLEDEPNCDEPHDQEEGISCNGTAEPLQITCRRKIKETEDRYQERALAEKDILYKQIYELESMLLNARTGKGHYVWQ
jgi:hypothetical protein